MRVLIPGFSVEQTGFKLGLLKKLKTKVGGGEVPPPCSLAEPHFLEGWGG